MPVRDTTRRPSFEEMTSPCQLRRIHHAAILTFAVPDKEDEPAALCDAGDDAAGAAEVCGGDVEGDDVDARADTEDVAAVERVPEGCGVAEVRLGGEEEREGDFGWRRRVGEEGMRGVMGSKRGSEVGGQGFYGEYSAGWKRVMEERVANAVVLYYDSSPRLDRNCILVLYGFCCRFVGQCRSSHSGGATRLNGFPSGSDRGRLRCFRCRPHWRRNGLLEAVVWWRFACLALISINETIRLYFGRLTMPDDCLSYYHRGWLVVESLKFACCSCRELRRSFREKLPSTTKSNRV